MAFSESPALIASNIRSDSAFNCSVRALAIPFRASLQLLRGRYHSSYNSEEQGIPQPGPLCLGCKAILLLCLQIKFARLEAKFKFAPLDFLTPFLGFKSTTIVVANIK